MSAFNELNPAASGYTLAMDEEFGSQIMGIY